MINEQNKQIENLFPDDKTVSALQIKDYLAWAANPKKYSSVLDIPPIQRGFVWNAKKIQDLWDSLLRGMPIGSVLLKAAQAGEQSGDLTPSKDRPVRVSQHSGFHLMDGQQRTLAMLLGFPDSTEAEHKLWVDFAEAGKNGSIFQFRVTTAAQPFGFNIDGSRFSLNERRNARAIWDGEDEVLKVLNRKKSNVEIFKDERTRPWKAGGKRQEFIFEVKDLWKWLDVDGLSVDKWVVVQKCIMQDTETKFDDMTFARVLKFRSALKELQNQWLALIKIPDVKVQADIEDPAHDYLTMLFDRISSGGAPLKPEDLLFSMIKQSWPEAHNVVYGLQKKVGSLMKPTDFVMTAFRLAMLQLDGTDPDLNAKTFHKHLHDLLGSKEKPGKLRNMIVEGGTLSIAFTKLIEMIQYRKEDDYGIPLAMFPYLNESMLQAILHWMIKNQGNTAYFEESRDDILRFILFWSVCHKDAKSAFKAGKAAIKIISNENGCFPGKEIYQELIRTDDDGSFLFFPLITPVKKELKTTKFRKVSERKEYFFMQPELYHCFTSRRHILIWLQRKWVEESYPEFSPVSGQDDDNVPYDFDHLVPQSNWSSLFNIEPKGIEAENEKVFKDLYHRRAIGNSIGNYRVMDSSDNRSRGAESLQLNLLGKKDEWIHYAFNPNDSELGAWNKASPVNDDKVWNDTRLLEFQYAIESRVLYLYECFYEAPKFSQWLQNEPAAS